jgi:hypothetical protein
MNVKTPDLSDPTTNTLKFFLDREADICFNVVQVAGLIQKYVIVQRFRELGEFMPTGTRIPLTFRYYGHPGTLKLLRPDDIFQIKRALHSVWGEEPILLDDRNVPMSDSETQTVLALPSPSTP